ncbi:MacB family efflux pump subunit [Ferrovibrio sp.]|uniref:MacB family efflux pump subunit n=1 Tax=Ferrovibrio sp. TaxID=1917215 RepID=UPI0025BDF1D0|nr:MacB family efflux pump subunit [Ferrovibrio sp.]
MTAMPQIGRVETAATSQPLISLRNITKSFSRGSLSVEVLHGISLDIHPGEFVAIMGASGSGKSTLMNLIGLLDRPTSGSYRYDGREVAELDADGRALLRREAFGFIFQQYNLLPGSSAAANVELPAIYAGLGREARHQRAVELLQMLGLGERLEHKPTQLSGGQQQRVSIARALMNGGPVILADEPTGALDSKSGAEVMKLLRDLNQRGHTILLITHDAEVARQARRVVEIRDGDIVSDQQIEAAGPQEAAAPPRHTATRPRAAGANLLEAGRMALQALRGNLLRTLLTLLGIIIGVASVVAMLAIGDGARQSVLDRISAMGTNLLLIRPGAPNMRQSGGVTATLVPADAEALNGLANVTVAVGEYSGQVTARFANNDYLTQANAVGAGFAQARDWPVAEGVFFSDEDVRNYVPVAVLGQTILKALFDPGMPASDALGRYVLLNNIPFQVIGVLEAKGASPMGTDMDDTILVPLSTGILRLFGQRYVRTITVQVKDVTRIDETQELIRQTLIGRHKAEDFQIRNMAAIIQTATETQNTLTLLLGSIAIISLLVGGIGVMNIMLVSVTERTREIGVRMATGARRMDILLQFNTEALVICILGGALGVLLGLGATALYAAFDKPVIYAAGPVLLAFGCAFFTGLTFGYLPARKAAGLDPVVALATE